MMPVLQDVIAERTYEAADGRGGGVRVRLGRPAPDPEGDWNCPFQVVGPYDEGEVYAAYGVDALQALFMAIQMIRAQLQAAPGLTWLGGDDLGFDQTG